MSPGNRCQKGEAANFSAASLQVFCMSRSMIFAWEGRLDEGEQPCAFVEALAAFSTFYELRDPGLRGGESGKEDRNEWPEIGEPVRPCPKDEDRDRESCEVLLERQIPVDGHEGIELLSRQGQQFTILDGCPPHLPGRLDVMPDDVARQSPIDALVEQDSHDALATSSSFASSRRPITWSRVTVGKPSRKSSMVSPASRYSSTVWTGTRVPANTGVPPITSGLQDMIGRFTIREE